jgi:hypothetical protein
MRNLAVDEWYSGVTIEQKFEPSSPIKSPSQISAIDEWLRAPESVEHRKKEPYIKSRL